LAEGILDIFRGEPDSASLSRVNRIETKGADELGLTVLAFRRAALEMSLALRVARMPDAADQFLQWGNAAYDRGMWEATAACYSEALARRPNFATAANALAWSMLTRPNRGDPRQALLLVRKAVSLQPQEPLFRNTLGVALYRTGEVTGAAAELERNLAKSGDSAGYDWVFLAMCRQRLGQPAEARAALAEARKWYVEKNRRLTRGGKLEFQALLTEAEAVLGGASANLPSNPFAR
jgi:tetratricopeptide (TPR) repeat protein